MSETLLDARELAFLAAARHGILATVAPDGRPRLVPVCFIVDAAQGVRVLTPLDDKPKLAGEKRDIARARDIRDRPEVSVLIERWDEDWSRLAWLRLHGRATLVEPDEIPADAVGRLREKYAQYATHDLEASPMISIDIERAVSWGALDPA